MRNKIYTVILEISDSSESDAEDIELWIDNALQHGLPNCGRGRRGGRVAFAEDPRGGVPGIH